MKAISWPRAALAAGGDFACNLYWQSVTLFLLFYYTETLQISPAVAGAVYLAGLAWDGAAGMVIGLLADRISLGAEGGLRAWVRLGAVPL
ncbi:MAG TPA: MFS transporter, partial [Allosphingosinicella sp.]|nr:MFS transporter [Allosphingosinicella sp.]